MNADSVHSRRRRKALAGLTFLAIAAMLAGACAGSSRARPDLPPEERGVAELDSYVRDVYAAAQARDFEHARELLDDARRALAQADAYTQSHPDFEDVKTRLAQVATALDAAIAADRQARREAAVQRVIGRCDAALPAGFTVYKQLFERPPTRADVATLGDVVESVEDILGSAEEIKDEATFVAYARRQEAVLTEFKKRLKQAEWQLLAAETLAGPLGRAIDKEKSAGPGRDDRPALLADAGAAYSECQAEVSRLERHPDFTADYPVATVLGNQPLAAIKEQCQSRGGETAQRQRVEAVIAQVNGAVRAVREAAGAAAALQAGEAAAGVLSTCERELARTPVPRGTFSTVFGSLSVAGLRRACAKELGRLDSAEPRLRLKLDLEALSARVKEAQQQLQSVSQSPPAQRTQLLVAAEGGFLECAERAGYLRRTTPDAERVKVRTPFGRLNLEELQSACRSRYQSVRKLPGNKKSSAARRVRVAG